MADVTFTFDGTRYAFDPNRMSVLEGIELKKFTGLTFMEWIGELEKFDAEAFRFLVWVSLCRDGKRPDGKYSAFDFDMAAVMGTFEVESDEPEVEPDPTPARRPAGSKKRSSSTAH